MRLLAVEDARARMLAGIGPGPAEQVALDAAVGRVLAAPVRASRDQPPFDASAMDGWAVRSAEVVAEVTLDIAGESAAGRGFDGPLPAGAAVRIFTGAPVPKGADRVVVQEEAAVREGARVRLGPAEGQTYVRPRGGDFRAGDVLLAAGVRLDPWRLALCAGAGLPEVAVAPRPRVAILSTGDEIVAPGETPAAWQIFDSGAPALAARAAQWGAAVERLAPAGDDLAALTEAVRGSAAELVVTVGGASVGTHDLVKPALARLGLELAVESVAVRPGKPTWFGTLKDGRRVLGLPGNPASALVCAELFLGPLIRAWQGLPPGPALTSARLAAALPANGPREHWMRARLEPLADGALHVHPFPDQDSSLVTVFAAADALLRRPAQAPPARPGERVEILPLPRL